MFDIKMGSKRMVKVSRNHQDFEQCAGPTVADCSPAAGGRNM